MSHGITDTDTMFSVNSQRKPPWHGLGVVLGDYSRSIDEALVKAGLGWKVSHGDVLVVKHLERTDEFGIKHSQELIPAKGSRRTSVRTPATCSGSSPTNTRSWTIARPLRSWTR
jgi:hypothetical protein